MIINIHVLTVRSKNEDVTQASIHCRQFESYLLTPQSAAALAQCVKSLTPQAEGWEFESKPQQTYVVKKGSDARQQV